MQFNHPKLNKKQKMKTKNMTTLHLRKSIGRPPWRRGCLLIAVALACFGLSPAPKAFGVSPAPDGGYPGGNTAEGDSALFSLTTGGVYNTANGLEALFSDTTGSQNTANGAFALPSNTTGNNNTANGFGALYNNMSGSKNTANGVYALYSNTTGDNNTANGLEALFINTTGDQNTANGAKALFSNTTGYENTAVGFSAMANATGASVLYNTAVGWNALVSTTANANVAVGDLALENDTSGYFNVAIGAATGQNQTTGHNNIYIGQGSPGVAGESNTCYIQEIYTNIQPVVGTNPDYVTVNSVGKLGRANISSRRYKHDIKPIDKASEAIFALKPVSFRYNKEYDATQTIAFGLIAEDVAQVYPDLVGRNPDGQPESVRYEQINAMLLNEFLKEHRKVEEQGRRLQQQEATIAQQQKEFASKIALQQKQIEALTAGLQQVSTQVEMSRPVPQMVLNNQ